MLAMNRHMVDKINAAEMRPIFLPAKLLEVAKGGFCAFKGCSVLCALSNIDTNVDIGDFSDKTGFECFMNSIYLDDFVESNHVGYAITLIDDVFSIWHKERHQEQLSAILSSDEMGTQVKFHVVRPGELWVSDDLESYEDALLVADSSSWPIAGKVVGAD